MAPVSQGCSAIHRVCSVLAISLSKLWTLLCFLLGRTSRRNLFQDRLCSLGNSLTMAAVQNMAEQLEEGEPSSSASSELAFGLPTPPQRVIGGPYLAKLSRNIEPFTPSSKRNM
ncbi:hypothetical protein M427DRAFT_386863 [Gonapodya prolifera JEL478]|uniref:Uncharacterized protein n=1 Tax=Gonapodya prolifera (strain JEL478) TaxID=1344416 RepID=A0A139A802_GONPJ|nr:hypothetical protein M427DRAFT_386863 [Gonapodya prolifera JEL478]|eukprot:KXS12922.1 hypothetical protein M427DRAFT_386863 [Gonapodya prolifera JEL478]